MKSDITVMDCWHFIAPLIPVNTDYTMDIYIMVFNAPKEAEKKRIAKKKGGAEKEEKGKKGKGVFDYVAPFKDGKRRIGRKAEVGL